MRPWFLWLAGAWCAIAPAFAAGPLTAAQLQSLLQAGRQPEVAYEEVRESPWLGEPVRSRGKLRSSPQALEKRVETPRRETWRLLPDRVEWIGPGTGERKEILFAQVPALRPLADVTRLVAAGDLAALERTFTLQIEGDPQVWSVQLKPRDAALGRQISAVELQGGGGRLQVLIVTERSGERTTTRLMH